MKSLIFNGYTPETEELIKRIYMQEVHCTKKVYETRIKIK